MKRASGGGSVKEEQEHQIKQDTKTNQYQMTTLFWNIRGMGKRSRIRQLKEIIITEKVEIVGIQETIKQDFTS